MADLTLSDSVGNGGANQSADVRALKQRLVDLGYDWLTVDDAVDDDLEHVINLVQSIKAGRDRVSGDGRVDVPGPTYEWLRAQNAPRWQQMPQGTRAEGFFSIERTPEGDNHDFGTDWMAETIRAAGIWYRDTHLATHPDAALLTINDVSHDKAQQTDDHGGHETGMACDVRLPRRDGTAPGATTFRHDLYDQDAMRAMLQAVRHQPYVSRIFFNDPVLIGENLCRRVANHDNHAHFELAPLLPITIYDEEIDVLFERAVNHFGGPTLDPTGYPMTEGGFQSYLDDLGVRFFTAREMLTPHHPRTAAGLGYDLFLPPHRWWPRGAALVLLADRLRALVDEPVTMRNWWRPPRYNAEVEGAEESEHIAAYSVDLDYRSADSRRRAERFLGELADDEPWLQLSQGLGLQTTHVGILSPKGKRVWHYDSYVA